MNHSTDVSIRLDTKYGSFQCKRVGPKSAVLCEPVDFPACDAILVVTVDGEELKTRVRLPLGDRKARGAVLLRVVNE